jgi:transmembrane sensor
LQFILKIIGKSGRFAALVSIISSKVSETNYASYKIEDFLSDESFINYCLNENPADVLLWESILKSQPALIEITSQSKALFYLLSIKVNPSEKETELLKLQATIEQSESAGISLAEARIPEVKNRSWALWSSMAAALIICLGLFLTLNKKDYSHTVPVYSQVLKKNIIKTGINERRSVQLPDGSTVLLNSLTELRIDPDYNRHNRVLWLKGEAYFSVSKNKDKPFIVISGNTATTALGTSFKINNYKEAEAVSIMLATGKVNVGTVKEDQIRNHIQLLPGEELAVNESAKTFLKSSFPLKAIDDWTSRKVVFSMATLKDIKSILKETYGIEIISRNQPKKPIAFTGEFKNESLTEVLDAIGFSNHFKYSVTGDKVLLKFE